MKKILIVLMSFVLFFVSVLIPFEETSAAVASKVVNAGAKKIAKEIVKDTAVQMSMDMVLNYKYIPKDQRTPKQGYSFICMPKDKTSNGDCNNLLEIKETLTESEKKVIGNRAEQNLDNKILGGVGATKWGKFLNWFVPIFSIGMGVAVIDYAIDGDVSDLFDDIAFESLKDLGFITLPEIGDEEQLKIMTGLPADFIKTNNTILIDKRFNDSMTVDFNLKSDSTDFYYVYTNPSKTIKREVRKVSYVARKDSITGNNIKIGETLLITNDGNNLRATFSNQSNYSFIDVTSANTNFRESTIGEQSIVVSNAPKIELYRYSDNSIVNTSIEVPTIPKYDQLSLPRINKENSPLEVPAPGSLPFKKTDTSETLYPYTKPDGTTGFKTKSGVIVDENLVEVDSPIILDQPDGSRIVKKQPTFATPNPSPNEDGLINPSPESSPPGQKPPEKPMTQLGENLPIELIIALLDMLRSILFYMVRLATFILSIPLIVPKPIPYESLRWFFNVEFVGVNVMTIFRSLVLFSLSLGIFKILRKVF